MLVLKPTVAVGGAFAVVCDEARWKAEHLRNGCSSRRDYRQRICTHPNLLIVWSDRAYSGLNEKARPRWRISKQTRLRRHFVIMPDRHCIERESIPRKEWKRISLKSTSSRTMGPRDPGKKSRLRNTPSPMGRRFHSNGRKAFIADIDRFYLSVTAFSNT